MKHYYNIFYRVIIFFLITSNGYTQVPSSKNQKNINGYKGIWFTLGQFTEMGDKYSGGLGTYTAKHVPLAIYAGEVEKTFFVYGGTTGEHDRYLLCMVGSFDHQTGMVSKPTVVYDKQGVDDPHDNPSLAIDGEGYLWVFVSGRGQHRPGFKYKSRDPYSTEAFDQITEEEMTYPQPKYISGQGFLNLFTKYTGVRELYYETSSDGENWSEDKKLSGIKREGDERSGHYQMSSEHQGKVGTFMNWHPNGNVDQRTNLYYVQTLDFGKTWTTIKEKVLDLPLTALDGPARVLDYFSHKQNVYLKDMDFDEDGHPVGLYILSGGHEAGPANGPREWHVVRWDGFEWQDHLVTTSDHNYDMGSLFIENGIWRVVGPTETEPQEHGGGGEVVIWESTDKGSSWQQVKQVTKNSVRNHNYIRRVVNGREPFRYFWADGNPDEFSPSLLYFGDFQGNVWQLPYDMYNDKQKPTQRRFY
jgi:hypothetical protein